LVFSVHFKYLCFAFFSIPDTPTDFTFAFLLLIFSIDDNASFISSTDLWLILIIPLCISGLKQSFIIIISAFFRPNVPISSFVLAIISLETAL
jgi:hypothetical protein